MITFQAEDEIAAVTSAIGAAYAGAIGITTTSGPGMALKTEAMGLAVAVELPLVICDVQRGGPSTGLPTKTEQADLLQALYGRNSEAPIPVLAPATPGDCFWIAMEATRIAIKYMVPVIILSDGYLANGAEPWRIPELSEIPDFPVTFATDPATYQPYKRNPETLARQWAIPGTLGLEHRLGGLEKQDGSGNINRELAYFGNISFDGKGGYTLSSSNTLNDTLANIELGIPATGTYSVASSGYGFLSNPLAPGESVYFLVSKGVLIGSATENTGANS